MKHLEAKTLLSSRGKWELQCSFCSRGCQVCVPRGTPKHLILQSDLQFCIERKMCEMYAERQRNTNHICIVTTPSEPLQQFDTATVRVAV